METLMKDNYKNLMKFLKREKIVGNFWYNYKNNPINELHDLLSQEEICDLIYFSFPWHFTKEERDFWKKIYLKLGGDTWLV